VVKVDGRSVRLGVEAPRDVHVLRHEVAPDNQRYSGPDREPASAPRLRHKARNRLNTALLSLGLLQRKVELGQLTASQIDSQLSSAIAVLEEIESEFTRSAAPTAQSETAPERPRKLALVVDDDANERSLLVDFLQTFNYDVAIAGNGQEALDYCASQGRPDVVLLDMMMPQLDGPATVREFRSDPKLSGVKLFAVSGLEPKEAAVEIGPRGVDRWFTKPIRASALVREIDRELAALV
jgi:CheY-like chemotaxis protein